MHAHALVLYNAIFVEQALWIECVSLCEQTLCVESLFAKIQRGPANLTFFMASRVMSSSNGLVCKVCLQMVMVSLY